MIFTTEERRLFNLFHSGSVETTVSVVSDALADINEPDVRAAAVSVLEKLESMSDAEYNIHADESGVCYAR